MTRTTTGTRGALGRAAAQAHPTDAEVPLPPSGATTPRASAAAPSRSGPASAGAPASGSAPPSWALHTVSAVAAHGAISVVPGAHVVQAVHSRSVVGDGGADSYSSLSHTENATQLRSRVVLGGTASSSLAAQTVHGVHAVAFAASEYAPGAQGAHERSAVVLPLLATDWPATQLCHGAQVVALEVVENVPVAQGAHVRSIVALPGDETNVPAAHAVHATHADEPGAPNVPGPHAHVWPVVPFGAHVVPAAHGLGPATHVPAWHVSPAVQASPSLQTTAVAAPHVPSVAAPAATEHAIQSVVPPPHAVVQQTPSVQKPLSHSVLAVQLAPGVMPHRTTRPRARPHVWADAPALVRM